MKVNMLFFTITVTIFISVLNGGQALNILGVFPLPAKSHFFVFAPYLRELVNRGHNVTVISFYPQKEAIANYTDINLGQNAQNIEISHPINKSPLLTFISLTILHAFGGSLSCRILFEDENVQGLWEKKEKFDLVVVEQFNSDCALGLAHILGAPVIGITSHMLLPWHYNRFGVPYNPSFSMFDLIKGGTKPTFFQRIQRSIIYNHMNFVHNYMTQPLEQSVIEEFFSDVPPLHTLANDIKLILVYQNFMLSGSALLPPNVIEVGGYHVAKTKKLPDEISKFIDDSEHGVIYISFGTILKTSSISQEKLQAIISALSELPQRVIWKWNKKTLQGNPKNIYLAKWLPQNDILAHPNVVAFYSHCGLLGTTEALYHGVPIVGMPIFGDQSTNAATIEESGLGVQIDFDLLTKDHLLEKFRTVLNPVFREKVKELSKAWQDRPLKAIDTAIFWTEFAARNKNTTLRTPAADVPLYQYICLDVISIFIAFAIDLKKFVEEAEYGVVYISFGSVVKSSTMPEDKLKAVLEVIAELPQRFIWKWESKVMLMDKNKLYISSWLPQVDILAHPKTLAFLSHAGMGGTTEAIHFGVPVVAMPVVGDQPSNAAAIEESGLGVQLQMRDLTRENLLASFKKVLDPKFRENAKLVSKAWHDRPMPPLNSAIYWTEFAARYSNFTFRTAAADVPCYQYLNLDIIGFFTILFLATIYSFKCTISMLCGKRKKTVTEQDVTSKNRNKKRAKAE